MKKQTTKARKTTRKAVVCRGFSPCTGRVTTFKSHHYAWSGRIPCTGMWRCTRCGKPEDPTTFNGKPKGGKKR